jgi:hypothetical protein
MEDLGKKIICLCGQKSVNEAIEIFKDTDLPYKKAKKLVTGCNRVCCRRPLTALFNMLEFGAVDFEEIDLMIDQMNERMTTE